MPLPAIPMRARRGNRTNSFMRSAVAVESKPSAPVQAIEPLSNPGIKAREEDDDHHHPSKANEEPHMTVADLPTAAPSMPETGSQDSKQSDRSMAEYNLQQHVDIARDNATAAHVQPKLLAVSAERYHSDEEHHIVYSPEHLPRNSTSAKLDSPASRDATDAPTSYEQSATPTEQVIHEANHSGDHVVDDLEIEPLNISRDLIPGESVGGELMEEEPSETEASEKGNSLAREVDRAVSHLSEAVSILSVHQSETASPVTGPMTHEVDDDNSGSAGGIFHQEDEFASNAAETTMNLQHGVDSDSDVEEDSRHSMLEEAKSDYGDGDQPWPLPEGRGDSAFERHDRSDSGSSKAEEDHFAVDKANIASDLVASESPNSPNSSIANEVPPLGVGLGISHNAASEYVAERRESLHDPRALDDYLEDYHSREPEATGVPTAFEQASEFTEMYDMNARELPSDMSPVEMAAAENAEKGGVAAFEGVEKGDDIEDLLATHAQEHAALSDSDDDLDDSEPEATPPQFQAERYSPHKREESSKQEDGVRQSTDDAPTIQAHLAPGGSVTDTDSQDFFTPLASASMRSHEQRTLADELGHADDEESDYFEDHEQYQTGHHELTGEHTGTLHEVADRSSESPYQQEDSEEHTTTVRGADTLFDYDTHSAGSSIARSESPDLEDEDLTNEVESRKESNSEASITDQTVATNTHGDVREHQNAPVEAKLHQEVASSGISDQAAAASQLVTTDTHDNHLEHEYTSRSADSSASDHDNPRQGWEEEVDGYFDEARNPTAGLATPPLQPSQTPPTDVSQFNLQESPSVSKGLAASRHNPERPQTPVEESPEPFQDYEPEDLMPRDVTNVSWHARNLSTSQSVRSRSTISSAQSSPTQRHSIDNHDPAIRHSWQTSSNPYYAGRPRGDSTLTDNSGFSRFEAANKDNAPPMPHWEAQDSLTHEPPLDESFEEFDSHDGSLEADRSDSGQRSSSSTGGSLFQRMRNVFEQPAPNGSQRPVSFAGSAKSTGPLKKDTRFDAENDDEDDDSDEHSSLLSHQPGPKISLN